MVRPQKIKLVNFEPGVTYFKPRAVPLSELEEVELTIDELESMRLSNIEHLGQEIAAQKMGVHQSTFQRILSRAREKLTDALVNGKAIKINGGNYKIPINNRKLKISDSSALDYAKSNSKKNIETIEKCVCKSCGYEIIHEKGIPCSSLYCPNCNIKLERI